MTDGKGWHGDPDKHARAAKKGHAGPIRRTLMEVSEWVSGLWGDD